MEKSKTSKDQISCRYCSSTNMKKYLDMGETPLANSYLCESDLSKNEFKEELAIQICLSCGLSQLTKVVDPDLMYKNYLFVSSTTKTFQDHCVGLAKESTTIAFAGKTDLVIDIASNDGCLLSKYSELGLRVLGVDPAINLAKEANEKGITTICDYWSTPIAQDIVNKYGQAKIITATNVFAHVDDIHTFLDAVDICLISNGIFVIEVPYLVDFINNNEFDTAYHEHLSYIAVTPLMTLMQMHKFNIFNVKYFGSLHGGTIRIYSSREGDYARDAIVETYLKNEESFGVKTLTPYQAFSERVMKNKEELRSVIMELNSKGKIVWAYGASAKGNTLMNFYDLEKERIPKVIDDNPKKIGLYTPGSRMLITSIDSVAKEPVDYLLLLAWNYRDEIIMRCKKVNYQGKYILPVPKATIVSQ